MGLEGRKISVLRASEILGYPVLNAKIPTPLAEAFNANTEIGLWQNSPHRTRLPLTLADGTNYGVITGSGDAKLDQHMVVGIPVGQDRIALLLVSIK